MASSEVSRPEVPIPVVRGELSFDSIRVYLDDVLHIDVRRSAYRGLQAWNWSGTNCKIEISVDGVEPILIEYTKRELWAAVLAELKKLPLNGN